MYWGASMSDRQIAVFRQNRWEHKPIYNTDASYAEGEQRARLTSAELLDLNAMREVVLLYERTVQRYLTRDAGAPPSPTAGAAAPPL